MVKHPEKPGSIENPGENKSSELSNEMQAIE